LGGSSPPTAGASMENGEGEGEKEVEERRKMERERKKKRPAPLQLCSASATEWMSVECVNLRIYTLRIFELQLE